MFDEMPARKYIFFSKIERNLLGLYGDGSYNLRGILMG
jgi:hypothetical protein